MKKLHAIFFICIVLLLTGCASQQAVENDTLPQVFQQTPQDYLAQANNAQGQAKQMALLQASAAYFYYQQPESARKTLYRVRFTQLPPAGYVQYQLLAANLALHDKNYPRALALTQALTGHPALTQAMQVEQLKLMAKAYEKLKQPQQALNQLLLAEPLIDNPAQRQQLLLQIWQQLRSLTTTQLSTLADSTDPLSAWAQLALLITQSATQPALQLQEIQQWQNQHPDHPANLLISRDLRRIIHQHNTIEQVAVLLPLTGSLRSQAQAVERGILAHYYQQPNNIRIKVYDTNAEPDIVKLYQQAIADGANFVIGPLAKPQVAKLLDNDKFTVPTLLLNMVNAEQVNNAYQFALSPEQEADDAALRAAKLGHKNALIISPDNAWGKTIANRFAEQWQALGGQVMNQLAFNKKTALRDQVSILLNINQSNWRKIKLQRLLGQPIKFSARRRHDFDVIFLNALPSQARQIVPLLRFYYSGNIPIYATGQIYSGRVAPQHDRDLNQVNLPVMPWLIQRNAPQQKLYSTLKQLWSSQFVRYSRLFAFGYDAYQLVNGLPQLQAFPTVGLSANTGRLFLTDNHIIRRQLLWAHFKDGQVKLLPPNPVTIAPITNENPA